MASSQDQYNQSYQQYLNMQNPMMGGLSGKDARSRMDDQNPFWDMQGYLNNMPAPTYNKTFDPTTQNTYGTTQANQANDAGYNALSKDALRTGPSAWAGLATAKQGAEEASASQNAMGKAAGQRADASSMLARTGGLDSGARERLARGSSKNAMDMQQDIQKQGGLNRMQIGMNDESNRIQQVGQLSAADEARNQDLMKSQQFDTSNAMSSAQGQNQFNMSNYQNQMAGYGAYKTAQATKDSKK